MSQRTRPVVIIGGGPVGLAAAAHALARGLTPLVLESGPQIGDGVRRWGHVRMFSPWRYNIDAASAAILARGGWSLPPAGECPTGHDLVERYLEPLAASAELAPAIRLATRVVGVCRPRHDRMKDGGRQEAPFVVRAEGPGGEEDITARAVIDASGTMGRPAPLGASGLPALGERAAAARIFYGIPDIGGRERGRYAGRRVLVAGSGHSAMNALLELARLAEAEPDTHITWLIRREATGTLLGGPRADQLEGRGQLVARARTLLEAGRIELITGFRVDRVETTAAGIVVHDGPHAVPPVDEIVAATGFRPDWSMLAEVRLDLDPALESSRALAPLIDPNVHSCGTVPPHGAEELRQPDANLYVAGMKSYGRAPTFLLLTGYEQVRSVVSAIAGDWEAARRVELVLPETGVCSTDSLPGVPDGSCCGTAPDARVPVAIGGLAAARQDVVAPRPPAQGTARGPGCCEPQPQG